MFMVFSLSLAMFVGCYVSGLAPLLIPLSQRRLRLVTVLGAGLLVGTALAVIIPEGVEAVYDDPHHSEHKHGDSHIVPTQFKQPEGKVPTPRSPDVKADDGRGEPSEIADDTKSAQPAAEGKAAGAPVGEKSASRSKRTAVLKSDERETHGTDDHHHHHTSFSPSPHTTIGVTLVLGFVFMLVVDQFSRRTQFVVSSPSGLNPQKRYSVTATIGLVVHAAADGVALGAASGTEHSDIQLILFLAIMLHKAPASFGLVSFLLHEGLDRSRIRKHLLIFSLAAPVTALLSYLLISQSSAVTMSSVRMTGALMLFSAGTFLYVATVHVLPELTGSGGGGGHSHLPPLPSNSVEAAVAVSVPPGGLTTTELLALVVGAVMPIFMSLGHSHGS